MNKKIEKEEDIVHQLQLFSRVFYLNGYTNICSSVILRVGICFLFFFCISQLSVVVENLIKTVEILHRADV